MGFKCGIVGLPNVGKSTLFNAITAAGAEAANYPFCTIEPNVGMVIVQDDRVDKLVQINNSQKIVPSSIEFVDIAGLVKGASQGEGLGNQFLSHIRDVDAIVHVVRCFDDPNTIHVDGSIHPKRDIEVIETELILKDLETIERKIHDAGRRLKTDKKIKSEVEFYCKVKDHLSAGNLAQTIPIWDEEEKLWLRDMHLLTSKPMMYVCNVHEKELVAGNKYVEEVREIAARESTKVLIVSAAIESEIAALPQEERSVFLKDLGLKESGLQQIVREGMDMLGLITFFTAGPKETHAWTIQKGARAPEAAGIIHSDFEKGFIRAEIMKYENLCYFGEENKVKEAGLVRVEGREYVIEDGDICYFRFNV